MDSLFPGLRGLENIHPLFVAFPFALLQAALLFQLLFVWKRREDFHRTAVWLLWLGTLGAMAAAATGWWAEKTVEHAEAAHELLELHETLMLSTTGLAILLSFAALLLYGRMSGRDHLLFLGGLVVLSGLLLVGADRGGQLVFEHGVAVQRPAPASAPSEETPSAPASEAGEEHEHDHEH
ncbi:MAG: DUF2231 domain-containing protein [Candidatus Acidoferrales bacterium]